MNTENTYTAFIGNDRLITDSLLNVALTIKTQQNTSTPVLILMIKRVKPLILIPSDLQQIFNNVMLNLKRLRKLDVLN